MSQTNELQELEGWIGRESTYDGVDEVSRNDIRRKLEVFCFDCPLYTDDVVAQGQGYRMAVAPSAMIPLWALPAYWSPGSPSIFGPDLAEQDGTVPTPMPMFWQHGVNAASEVAYFEPVYPGDRLRSIVKLAEVKPRKTRLGEGAFLTLETTIVKHSGETVSVRKNTSFRYNKTDDVKEPAPKESQAKESVANADAGGNVPVDWSLQRRFREIAAGDETAPYSIWLSYQRIVMSVAVDRMFSGIHHNREAARAQGLDDIILNTRGYEMILELMLRSWMGLAGRLKKIGPFRMITSGHPGDTLVSSGRVTALQPSDLGGIVTLDVWVDSPRGRAAVGEAQIWLP